MNLSFVDTPCMYTVLLISACRVIVTTEGGKTRKSNDNGVAAFVMFTGDSSSSLAVSSSYDGW